MKNYRLLLFCMLSSLLISLYSCAAMNKRAARAFSEGKELAPFDAIIVPGVPFDGRSWDSTMKLRVLWSYILYKSGYTKNIIYSGSAVYTPYKEAIIMGLYGQELGVPKENIFYDTIARHSTENIFYSYLLAQKLGFKSIALCTDVFQAKLLRRFTRKRFSSPIYHLPAVSDSMFSYYHLNPAIDPTPARAGSGWISIKDQESFFKRLRGTMGKDIDWSAFPDRKVGPL